MITKLIKNKNLNLALNVINVLFALWLLAGVCLFAIHLTSTNRGEEDAVDTYVMLQISFALSWGMILMQFFALRILATSLLDCIRDQEQQNKS